MGGFKAFLREQKDEERKNLIGFMKTYENHDGMFLEGVCLSLKRCSGA